MSKEIKEDTSAIEITFGAPVHITREQEKRLQDLISDICDDYEKRHPDRAMWVFGYGSKMLCSPFMLSDDEPIPFDDSVLSIECAERENYKYQPESVQ